jgi:hypothetical protein
MPIRIRKLIGTVLLLILVIAWTLIAMAAAPLVLPNLTGWLAALYYVLSGLGWVLVAMPLVKWMQRPDPQPR